ncbi:MAG TPA: hypothetical protein VFL92_07850 [Sphingomonas sp.]|nr:hypothetical protein [Sphingomonas sp.]
MSAASIEALLGAQRLLIAALDADDVDAIARGSAAVEAALLRVRAQRDWRKTPDLLALAEEARTQADAARARVNILADMTSRRLARLAAIAGRDRPAGIYGRNGRIAL